MFKREFKGIFLAIAILSSSIGWVGSARPAHAQGALPAIVYNKPNAVSPQVQAQDLWLINPDGTGALRIPITPATFADVAASPLMSAENPVWSRDGQRIAVVGLVAGAAPDCKPPEGILDADCEPASPGGYAVMVFDPALGVLQWVAPLGTVFPEGTNIAFSPEGKRVAFTDMWKALEGDAAEFYVANVDGSSKTFVGFGIGGDTGSGIDWSPRQDLLILPIEIPYMMTVQDPNNPFNPPYSAPAEVTALVAARPVANGLASATLVTRPTPPVTTDWLGLTLAGSAHDIFPAFSPDGAHVAFVRNTAPATGGIVTSSIWIVDLVQKSDGTIGGANERQVIAFPETIISRVSWSPDGTQLVFDPSPQQPFTFDGITVPLMARGQGGLWMVNLNGTGLRQIQVGPASKPSWSPVSPTIDPLDPDQQAQQDMINRAASDPHFGAPIPGTFGKDLNRDPEFELRWMDFNFTGGRVVTIFHATDKADSSIRYTIFWDPDTGQWTGWQRAF